jgi:hypothetical protein
VPSHHPFDDTPMTWRQMARSPGIDEFRPDGWRKGSLASLGVVKGITFLHGTLHEHHSYVQLTIVDRDTLVCRLRMSLDQLLALGESAVPTYIPVTLMDFYGPNGMRQSRPAPPPPDTSRIEEWRVREETALFAKLSDLGFLDLEEAKVEEAPPPPPLASATDPQARLLPPQSSLPSWRRNYGP